ncbi:MAG: hypothetical protein ACYC5F_00845 [Thermoleophilia bacterium]
MTKRKVLPLAAVMLALLVGSVVGISKMSTNALAATAPNTQTTVQQAGSDAKDTAEPKEGVEKAEPANEQNLPGGGHQDQGEADHQFEGVE